MVLYWSSLCGWANDHIGFRHIQADLADGQVSLEYVGSQCGHLPSRIERTSRGPFPLLEQSSATSSLVQRCDLRVAVRRWLSRCQGLGAGSSEKR